MKAGLAKLFFNIDFACLLLGNEPGAQPTDFSRSHSRLGQVDGTAGQVRRGNIPIGCGGIAIDVT